MLQCVAVHTQTQGARDLCVTVCHSVSQFLTVCCSVLHCAAVCCSVLQRVAVHTQTQGARDMYHHNLKSDY